MRNLSLVTQRCYVHAVAKFAQHFNRSPDRLGLEEVRAYQIHLTTTGISWAGYNVAVCALRFLYGVTLGQQPQGPALLALGRPRAGQSYQLGLLFAVQLARVNALRTVLYPSKSLSL